VDTPESISKDPLERQLATDAKNFLISWLKDKKNLKIKTIKDDKYGRILGDIYSDAGECINDLLLADGYAWSYDGGTKNKNLQILVEQRKAKGLI
jgi:micrococcal nuclease